MSEERFYEHAVLPKMRIAREDDGSLEVAFDVNEWADGVEMRDLASWLGPSVETFGEHDDIARAIGTEPVSLRQIGKALADLMAIMRDARKLRRMSGSPPAWRFTAGPAPADGPANEWGEYDGIVRKAKGAS